MVYEPSLYDQHFFNSRVFSDLDTFKSNADLIIANRMTDKIADVRPKLFTRDLFGDD